MTVTNRRWRAVVEYRTDNGDVDVEHFFEEMEELHGLIEAGPDWHCIVKCTVTLNREVSWAKNLTVEQAEKL